MDKISRLRKVAEEKKTITFEAILMVEDYLDEDCDSESAFELAKQDKHGAMEMAAEELEDIIGYKPQMTSAAFMEFDAANVTHAGAHYECTFEGTAEDEAKVQEYIRDLTGE